MQPSTRNRKNRSRAERSAGWWGKSDVQLVRIGILGSGFMGKTNAETITRYLKNAELVAIAGGSRAQGLAEQYGVSSEPSAEALLARSDIDAVMISTPHARHASQ